MLADPETIKLAQSGDTVAFNEIVRLYRGRILGTVYRLIGRPEDVEDVTQDVFVRLYYSLDQLRLPQVFEPWLHRLTVNTTYDYLRKRRRSAGIAMADMSEEQVVAADALESGKRHEEDVEHDKTRQVVGALFENISDEDRILLTLKEIEGLSLKELQQIYEIKENALKVRLFRARKRALKALEDLKKQGKI
jgi:RNA polymerase sigma-70 factor (ECF subfamily)